ncbi:MAG: hypothetical protein ACRDNF_16890 [Streptosporangiaceae bacterium]
MYDMYSWDQAPRSARSGDDRAETGSATNPMQAVQAVQVALDRRDNGGEAGQ